MLLAIDASPADRIEEWIASASLPNLARLRARGTHGRIESTADYLVGTPWPTFNTGSLPPEHGWNYYLTWRPDLMRFVRPTQEWLPVDPFYRNFPLDGPRVIAIDVPHTYAARPFNGVELTGWGAEARVGPPTTFPAGLAERLRRGIGPMPIADELGGHQTARELLALRDELVAAAEWHARVGLMLMSQEPWNLFILGFGSLHRAGHKVWSHRATIGTVGERERQELDDTMRQVAIAIDRAVGRLVDRAGPDTRVVVFSLHGMVENYSIYPLHARILDRILHDEKRDDPETPARPLLAQFREAIPLRLRSKVKDALPYRVQDLMTLFWRTARSDWSRTKAFMLAADLEGLVQVNLKGRERDGIVEPGAEYDALLDEITAGFQTFHDIDTGDPLVLDVHRGRDIWPEAIQRRAMPDLVIRNPRRSAFGIRGFHSERYGTVRNYDAGGYVDGRSGHHVGEGWFVAGGADLSGAGEQPRVHELDLLATVHALLGQAMRPGMRGRPVAAMLPGAAGPPD